MSRGKAEEQMKKVLEKLSQELSSLRTGRANVAILENLKVEYYGSIVPVNQVGNISATDARTLEIKPWDNEGLKAVELAVLKSDLGLTPVNDGNVLRLNIPAPTMERRKELTRVIHKVAEEFRVQVRNVRRDAVEEQKKLEKDKKISQDDLKRSEQDIQKLTDQYIKSIDSLLAAKEKELLEV